MTDYSGQCSKCRQKIFWVPCPTGGWWAHVKHQRDDHRAETFWQPNEYIDDYGDWRTA